MPPTVRMPDTHLDSELADEVRGHMAKTGLSYADCVRLALREKMDSQTINFSRDAGRRTRVDSPYSFDGQGQFSLVRDAWALTHQMDVGNDVFDDAHGRFDAFRQMQGKAIAEFAMATTANAAEIIPPQYRPLLGDFTQDRPLYAAASKAGISNGRPFTVPGAVGEAGIDAAVGAGTEGTNRTENAAPVFSGGTVTPVPIQGFFRASRELIDSSNPAIDAVCMAILRESFARQTEAMVFTELNTAQSGTITAGFVPSGAMARTSTGAALPADLKKALAFYQEGRGQRPRSVIASSRSTVSEALETLDGSTVPEGSEAMWVYNGCGVSLSKEITGGAAGDGDAFILSEGDLWCWQSPLLEMQFAERAGPAAIDLVLFGYFAVKMVQPRGLASIRHT